MFCSISLAFTYIQFTSSIAFFEIYCCYYYCVSMCTYEYMHATACIWKSEKSLKSFCFLSCDLSTNAMSLDLPASIFTLESCCQLLVFFFSLIFLINFLEANKYVQNSICPLSLHRQWLFFFLNQWFSACTKAVGAVFNHLIHNVETYYRIRGIVLKNSLLRKSRVLHSLGYLSSLHSHHSCLLGICFPSHNPSSNQNTFLILVRAPTSTESCLYVWGCVCFKVAATN